MIFSSPAHQNTGLPFVVVDICGSYALGREPETASVGDQSSITGMVVAAADNDSFPGPT
ncbi:hypothetical protein ACFTWF_24210 [Rhodococcus sp. NPDC056960]|uniref:hypothetical protein n=1 Tax=Rhodococcus sp. NPDC056960 TaxID=3345982 RepID=UPI00363EFCA7